MKKKLIELLKREFVSEHICSAMTKEEELCRGFKCEECPFNDEETTRELIKELEEE